MFDFMSKYHTYPGHLEVQEEEKLHFSSKLSTRYSSCQNIDIMTRSGIVVQRACPMMYNDDLSTRHEVWICLF